MPKTENTVVEFTVTFTSLELAAVLTALPEWDSTPSRLALAAIARDNPYLDEMITSVINEMNAK